jgi:hypothetical protein
MTRVNGVLPGRLLAVANLKAGSSLQFCQTARRLPELAKLEGAPAVGQAWAALAAAADDAGAEFLSAETRALVVEELTAWDGSDPGLVSKWVPDRIAALHEEECAIATFALTCALAPYRVSGEMLAEVRKTTPTDTALISVAAWASARAARRIASWL